MSSLWFNYSQRGRFAILALLALLAAVVGAPAARAYEEPKFANVSNDGDESDKPRVAQGPDGNVHVVWDSKEGARRIQYAKGTWNGSAYTFGPKLFVADVGGWGFASPSIFVNNENQVMIVWTDPAVKVKLFDANQGPPAGNGTPLGGNGVNPTISADYNDRFHIAWNGDFQLQYCEFVNGACAVRDTFPESEGSLRPDIAVDDENNVHLLWEGNLQVRYRTRPSGGSWSALENIAPGVFGEIAVDGKGGIHIIASRDFNIQYCRKTLNGPCVDGKTFDFDSDIQPSIGATRGGNVAVIFRDERNKVLAINVFENNAWAPSDEVGNGSTEMDISPRTYTSRFSFVWGADFEIQHGHFGVAATTCDTIIGSAPAAAAAVPAQAAPVGPAQFTLPVRMYLPTIEYVNPTLLPPSDGC